MKKFDLFFVKTLMVLSLVFVVGCSKDNDSGGKNDGSTTVPDPEGTITVSMSNNGVKNVYVPIERGEGVTFHTHNNHEWMAIDISNNLIVQSGVVANLGKVNGLGSITKIPASGYASRTSVEINSGYVIRLECGDYVRVYVVEWRKNTSGGIIGAKVKYQHPWNP